MQRIVLMCIGLYNRQIRFILVIYTIIFIYRSRQCMCSVQAFRKCQLSELACSMLPNKAKGHNRQKSGAWMFDLWRKIIKVTSDGWYFPKVCHSCYHVILVFISLSKYKNILCPFICQLNIRCRKHVTLHCPPLFDYTLIWEMFYSLMQCSMIITLCKNVTTINL